MTDASDMPLGADLRPVLTPELLQKARAASSPDEIAELARKEGVDVTPQWAQNAYDRLRRAATGELADGELDDVAGGCGGGSPSYQYPCPQCGGEGEEIEGCQATPGLYVLKARCKACGHIWEQGASRPSW